MADAEPYILKISRRTVDKLGVKLYDRVAAVIAELVSNSYDADAPSVSVEAPLGEFLATRKAGQPADKGYTIKVSDDGFGMSPSQLSRYYLVVGADRRLDERGDTSPNGRPVMGRKGVGKLAPFGICKTIEVISAGSPTDLTPPDPAKPYQVGHIILNYDQITRDDEYEYKPTPGGQDRTWTAKSGTTIILRDFLTRKVPPLESLSEEVAQRFGGLIGEEGFSVTIKDNLKTDDPVAVTPMDLPRMPNTRIDFKGDLPTTVRSSSAGYSAEAEDAQAQTLLKAGFEYEGKFYPIVGWIGYAKDPVKRDIAVGVRIYCRKKFAAQTPAFDIPSGFTGEFQVKAYLVGELHCDWLDEEDDLIHTDRQNIQWSSDLGEKFKEWGQQAIREVGRFARRPAAESTLDTFRKTVRLEDRLTERFPSRDQNAVKKRARDIAETLARRMSPTDAADERSAMEIFSLATAFAPNLELSDELTRASDEESMSVGKIAGILGRAKFAESMILGTVAEKRLDIIERFKTLIDDANDELDLQKLIEGAPWLIRPEWTPISQNQSMSTVRSALERFLSKKAGEPVTLTALGNPRKRPDFVLIGSPGPLQIVEIKKPEHDFNETDYARLLNYVQSFDEFFAGESNKKVLLGIPGWKITLVADGVDVSVGTRYALDGLKSAGKLEIISWDVLIEHARKVHEDFLKAVAANTTSEDDDA